MSSWSTVDTHIGPFTAVVDDGRGGARLGLDGRPWTSCCR